MRLLLALAIGLALAPLAAAEEVATPVGDGGVAVDLDGQPLAFDHDPGAEGGVGDDTLALSLGVREARLTMEGLPVGFGLDAGLRGGRIEQGALAQADAALEALEGQLPPELLVAWPWVGPEGVDVSLRILGYDHDGGAEPMPWRSLMFGQPWGLQYDGLVLPAAVDGSSEGFLSQRFVALLDMCAWTQEKLQVQLGTCADLASAVEDNLLDIRVHGENPALSVNPAAPAPLGAPDLVRPAVLASVLEGVPGAVPAQADETLLGELLLTLGGTTGDAALRGAREAPGPGASAQQLAAAPLGLNSPLPLAVAALALPFLAWMLYRRILPSRALHHPVREDLVRRVRAHPGIHESQLAREMGLRHTHVQYHIRVLEEAGVLETRRFGGLKCLFELGRLSPQEKAFAMADRGRGREVLETVLQQPGIAQRELARALAMSESSVKWHLDRLEHAGMVRTERARGAKRAWGLPASVATAPPLPAAPAVTLSLPAPPAPL